MASESRLAFLVALALGVLPVAASAEEQPPTDGATAPSTAASRADILFQEGKQLLEAGKFVDACEKLAQSDVLDPAIGTLGLLAACHEQQGRAATAWREYLETATRAKAASDERESFARARAEALEPNLPRVSIRLAGKRADASVFRNGVRVSPEDLGVAVPIDAGTYEIVARWPDKPEFRTTVTATANKTAEVEVPDPHRKPEAVRPKETATGGPPVPPPGSKARKAGAVVAGAVGALGFGLAAGFAIAASSRNQSSLAMQQSCAMDPAACAKGRELRDSAFTAATVSNIGFGVGAVGALTAVVVLLLPESKPSVRANTGLDTSVVPWVGKDVGGASVVGHF